MASSADLRASRRRRRRPSSGRDSFICSCRLARPLADSNSRASVTSRKWTLIGKQVNRGIIYARGFIAPRSARGGLSARPHSRPLAPTSCLNSILFDLPWPGGRPAGNLSDENEEASQLACGRARPPGR